MALTLDDIQADETIEAATLQELVAAFNDLATKLNAAGQDPAKLNTLHNELVANAAVMQAALDSLGGGATGATGSTGGATGATGATGGSTGSTGTTGATGP